MSTRSLIGIYDKATDTVRYAYCHFDGYPGGVGKLLFEYYRTKTAVNALIDLKGFACLCETLSETDADNNKYSTDEFDNDMSMPFMDWLNTKAYGVEYTYLFDPSTEAWRVRRIYDIDLDLIAAHDAWNWI